MILKHISSSSRWDLDLRIPKSDQTPSVVVADYKEVLRSKNGG